MKVVVNSLKTFSKFRSRLTIIIVTLLFTASLNLSFGSGSSIPTSVDEGNPDDENKYHSWDGRLYDNVIHESNKIANAGKFNPKLVKTAGVTYNQVAQIVGIILLALMIIWLCCSKGGVKCGGGGGGGGGVSFDFDSD